MTNYYKVVGDETYYVYGDTIEDIRLKIDDGFDNITNCGPIYVFDDDDVYPLCIYNVRMIKLMYVNDIAHEYLATMAIGAKDDNEVMKIIGANRCSSIQYIGVLY